MVTPKKTAKKPKVTKKAKAPKKITKNTAPKKGTPKESKKPDKRVVPDRQAIMKDLCDLISASNKSMASCLKELQAKYPEGGLDRTRIYDWMKEDTDLANKYARAKQDQADFLVEEMLAISDDDSEDAIFVETDDKSGKSAKMVCNNEFIQRSRLRVDTRKWIASKLKPKTYGDKFEIDTPADGHPLIVVTSAVGFLPAPAPATNLLENKIDEK